ncbi:MAG: protoglobin domain-containing protein [Thermodesulfovibrionales bacterium]|nr:protoglobin domain-containing protein [Thermodesulfovibrionales bacterium]
MKSFKEIKANYYFTPDDEKRLLSINKIMIENAEKPIQALHEWIIQVNKASQFFKTEDRAREILIARKKWFLDLFSGVYDSRYYESLIKIGQIHVKYSVDPHYMNRAINIIRNSCIDIITTNLEDSQERTKIIISLEKILDINLDVITSAYIEEEMRSYSSLYRVKNVLVDISEKLSQIMNFVLIFALIGLSIAIVLLFITNISTIIESNIEHVLITTLGSLLFLWVIIELINTEIRHLKGGKFRISIFVGVALVAFIREALVKALKHEAVEQMYFLIALILTLGIVFWLVSKAEEKI